MRLPRSASPLAFALLACTAKHGPPPAGASTGDADSRAALSVADRVLDDTFEQDPATVAFLRPPGARFDVMPDRSPAGIRARQGRLDGLRADLARVDRSRLSGAAALAYEGARDALEAELATRACHYERWWYVSPAGNGLLAIFTALAQAQPVGTDPLREQALARWGKLGAYVDTTIADLREGEAEGYAAYKGSVSAVVEQLDRLFAARATDSPLLMPAQRDGSPDFRARLAAALEGSALPALHRYRDFLAGEYLARARERPGVGSQREGRECYRAAVRSFTTLSIDPQKVHDTGWAELARTEALMKEIAAKSFGGAELPGLLERLRTDPAFRYHDRDEMMAQARATVARARAAMPRAFGLLPPDDVEVEPVPEFLEKSMAAHYQRAALDGSRPATFRIRLYQADQQSKILGESVAFHEAIPGHHLQIDIAIHRGDALPAMLRFGFNSGYAEGWGLYAEQLADELGLYSSDADRLGMLSNHAWRAVRLIVDSGIHALGWDRQRAIDTMLAHTAMSPDMAAAEVDRYIAWPGQACAYMLGYLEITSLRDEARRELGARFDLRAFHDHVLENGALPLPVLERSIRAWIASERAR